MNQIESKHTRNFDSFVTFSVLVQEHAYLGIQTIVEAISIDRQYNASQFQEDYVTTFSIIHFGTTDQVSTRGEDICGNTQAVNIPRSHYDTLVECFFFFFCQFRPRFLILIPLV